MKKISLENLFSVYQGHVKLLCLWIFAFILSDYLTYGWTITCKTITGVLAVLALLAIHRTKYRILLQIQLEDDCGYQAESIKHKFIRRTLLIVPCFLLIGPLAMAPIIPSWAKALIVSLPIYLISSRWLRHEIKNTGGPQTLCARKCTLKGDFPL